MIDYRNPDFTRLPPSECGYLPYKREADVPPVVAILTPYFNTEDLFLETARSVFAQSLQNFEWIIVDDGSTDEASLRRLKQVEQSDQRVRVIHQINRGPGAARNAAFRESSADYVCLLDSDDLIEPTYLETCVWFLESNPEFGFVNSWSVVFGEEQYLWNTGFERGAEHIRCNSGPPISVLRRRAYESCHGFDETIRFGHEDWDFWLRLAAANLWGYTLPTFLQWYRKRKGGRFEQQMSVSGMHQAFEQRMLDEYGHLETQWPSPSRGYGIPYEQVSTALRFTNPLASGEQGKRVLFLIPWMVTGGADRVNLDLLEGLRAQGYWISICATIRTDHNWQHVFSRFTQDIFVLPDFLRPADFPRFLQYLLRSRQIDCVVISGSTVGYHLLPFLRSVAPRAAFIDLCHVEEPKWLNGGHPRFAVGYQSMLDLNVVTSAHLKDWMVERGADTARIKVMYTGVRQRSDAELAATRRQVRAELGYRNEDFVVTFAGRICAQKRPGVLVRILRAAHARGVQFKAILIGNGELAFALDKDIAAYGLSDVVQRIESVPHERWLNITAASDVLLMPSDYEGISLALLEGMASGAIPVVSRVGGQDEIVACDAGFLIEHDSAEIEIYCDVLKRLSTDIELRTRMSTNALETARTGLSVERTQDQFKNLLIEAMALSASAPRHVPDCRLAHELATMSVEQWRVTSALDWLWEERLAVSHSNAPLDQVESAGARLGLAMARTRLARHLAKTRIAREFAKRLISRLRDQGHAARR